MHRESARCTFVPLATGPCRPRGRGSEETLQENHNIPIKLPYETLFFFQGAGRSGAFCFFTRFFAITPRQMVIVCYLICSDHGATIPQWN